MNMRSLSLTGSIFAALFVAHGAVAQDDPPVFTAAGNAMYYDLENPTNVPWSTYNLWRPWGGGRAEDCFGYADNLQKYLAKGHPEYNVIKVNSGINDRKWGGIDHPTLVLEPKKKGSAETLLVKIDIYNGYNGVEVTSAGVSPSEKKIAGDVMYLTNSPAVHFGKQVYVNQLLWSLMDDPAPADNTVGFNGSYGSVTVPHAQVVTTTDGRTYIVNRVEFTKKLEGRYGPTFDVKSVGAQPVANAAGTDAVKLALSPFHSTRAEKAAGIAGNLLSDDMITRFQVSDQLTKDLTVLLRSYYALSLPNPAKGFTVPAAGVQYAHTFQQGPLNKLTGYADTSKVTYGEATGLNYHLIGTVGYAPGGGGVLASAKFQTKPMPNLKVSGTFGVGGAPGNPSLPSTLANPTTDMVNGDSHPKYVSLGVDYTFHLPKWTQRLLPKEKLPAVVDPGPGAAPAINSSGLAEAPSIVPNPDPQ